jgi:hypothetical protein
MAEQGWRIGSLSPTEGLDLAVPSSLRSVSLCYNLIQFYFYFLLCIKRKLQRKGAQKSNQRALLHTG